MNRRTIPLFRILGIPIGLDYSWFVIFALITWMLAANYYPREFQNWSVPLYWFMGAFTAIMLFVSVLLHELGHSVVALYFKVPVRGITLFLFGGVAEIAKEPPSARVEFLIAIAGPIVSLALAGLFFLFQSVPGDVEPLVGVTKYLLYINMSLVIFNLIPGFPLDGGRVFRAFIWAVTKNLRTATIVASHSGRFFGFLFIMVGVWQIFGGNYGGGIWIAFIGWFLDNAASQQLNQAVFKGLLSGHTVSQAMSTSCETVPANLDLQDLVDNHILKTGRRCFLIKTEPNGFGLVTLHRIKEVPRHDWATTSAAQVMLPMAQLKRTSPDSDLWSALEQMDRDGVNQLPVVNGDQLVGMLSREDAISFLRRLQALGL